MTINNNPRAAIMNQKVREQMIKLFSSVPSIVAVISFTLMTVFTLIRIIATIASSRMLSPFAFLYYFGGIESVPIVNCIIGLVMLSFLVFMNVSIVFTCIGAKQSDADKIVIGLNLIKGSLIYALILSIIFILISLCSVSVMYQAASIVSRFGSSNPDAVFARINGINSQSLFTFTAFIGTLIVCILIGFINFSLSVRNSIEGTAYRTAGSVFSLIVSIIGAVSFFFVFFSSLRNLIMPSDVGSSISFSYVGTAGCDVIITASLCAVCAVLALISNGYRAALNYSGKVASSTFFYPSGQPHPDYVNTAAQPQTVNIHPEPVAASETDNK